MESVHSSLIYFFNFIFSLKSSYFPITLHGTPAATTPSGMSFVTTLPAPIITLSPMLTS